MVHEETILGWFIHHNCVNNVCTYRIFTTIHFFSSPAKNRYVSIQENRAFRKASLMMLTSQKARKYATFQPLFIFPWQQTDRLHMARYVQIDVSFREPVQTNVDCSKISPFVCGNISTNSVAKKYWYNSLSISQSEPRPSTEKVQLFIRFYYYSDSNIKVKFSEEPPSSQPCPFFLQKQVNGYF